MGKDVTSEMIEAMKGGITFSIAFLRAKDVATKRGTIEVAYIYSPFDDDGNVEAQWVDGFMKEVDLPYAGEELGIENFIKSTSGVNYLQKFHVNRMAMSVRTIVSVIEKAKDMSLYSNNQSLEGHIRWEKNLVRDINEHTSDLGAYMWYRYNNLCQASKYMISQMETCHGYLHKHRQLLEKKKEKKTKEDGERNQTEDSKEMEEDDQKGSTWDRAPQKTQKMDESDMRNNLLSALDTAEVKNNKSQHQQALCEYARGLPVKRGEKASKFMSKPKFNQWIAGDRVQKLDTMSIAIIQSYINKFGDSKVTG